MTNESVLTQVLQRAKADPGGSNEVSVLTYYAHFKLTSVP